MAIDKQLSEDPTSPPSETEAPHNELATLVTSLETPLKKVEDTANKLIDKIAETQVVLKEEANTLIVKAEQILERFKDTISNDTRGTTQAKIDALKEALEKNALAKEILESCRKLTTEISKTEPYPSKTIPVTEKPVDAKQEIKTLQEGVQKIGNILLKIGELLKQQGFANLVENIALTSFAELLSDWRIGKTLRTQITSRPKYSPKLTIEDWNFLLESLRTKVKELKEFIARLTEPDESVKDVTEPTGERALKTVTP